MFKLDNDFLTSLGLGGLPVEEKNKLLQMIYERLEMNVGMRLAEKMSDQQLDEFESFIDQNDEAGALKWLETNFPNYKDVVAEELEKLKVEVTQVAPQILAAQGGAGQEPAIMSDPMMPGVPQPSQVSQSAPIQQPTFGPQQSAPQPQPMQAPAQMQPQVLQPFYDQPNQHMQPQQQPVAPFGPAQQQPASFDPSQQSAQHMQPQQPAFAPQQPSFPQPSEQPLQPYIPEEQATSQPAPQPPAQPFFDSAHMQQAAPQPQMPAPQPMPFSPAQSLPMQPPSGFQQPQPAPGFVPQQPTQPQPQQFTPPPSFTPGQ